MIGSIFYVTAAGKTEVKRDLSVYTAIVPQDGGFATLSPTVLDAGVIQFAGVPAGPYFLRAPPSVAHIYTAEGSVDLSFLEVGRPDVAFTDGGTTFNLTVNGLAPWQLNGDELQLISGSIGLMGWGVENAARTAMFQGGETSLTLDLDYAAIVQNALGPTALAPLLDASKGDTAVLAQLVSTTTALPDGGSDFLKSLQRAVALPPITLADRGTVTGSSNLSPATSLPFAYTWQRSQFEALAPQISPNNPTPTIQQLYVSAMPYTNAEGFYTGTPDLLYAAPQPGATDVSGSVSFANPYGGNWYPMGSVIHNHFVRVPYPDGGTRTVGTTMTVDDFLPSFNAAPITPKISPPTALQVNGVGAAGNLTVTGLTPTVSWSPPTLGTASGYTVTVYQLLRSPGSPTINRPIVATVTTVQTSFPVPPGVLVAGGHYVFRVRARSAPGVEWAKKPFVSRLPGASAEALTGLITVQ